MRTATHTTSHFEHTNFEFLGNLNAHKVSVHRKDTYVSACKMSYWAMWIVNLVLKVSWMGETCVYIEWHDTFQPAKWAIGRKNTKIAKNRGYLVLDGNEISTSKEFVAVDGATTDIKHAEYNHSDDEATAYDLTGKPIGRAAKGIVIINNKKIIRR